VNEAKRPKVFVLGIDGATFRVIKPLVGEGKLPSFERMMREGYYSDLESTIPPISGPAWTSFATGLQPKDHGIFDFILKKEGEYRPHYINSRDVKVPTFWETLGREGYRVIVQNIMVTYPPKPVNGYLITGGLTPPGRPYTYPPELRKELEDRFGGYPHLPVGGISPQSDERKYVRKLFNNMDIRKRITRYLMREKPWDLFVVMFEGADSLQHAFWHYFDEEHPNYQHIEDGLVREAIPNFYIEMDRFVGEIIDSLPEGTTLIIMSDHGFGRLEKYFAVNNLLLETGMLRLKNSFSTRIKKAWFNPVVNPAAMYRVINKLDFGSLVSKTDPRNKNSGSFSLRSLLMTRDDIEWSKTKAFAMGSAGHIYINVKDREKSGIVELGEEYREIRREIIRGLEDLEDPETGGRVVEKVCTKRELFSGEYFKSAPDITIVPAEGYATLHKEVFTSPDTLLSAPNTGYHRPEGIFMTRNTYGSIPEISEDVTHIWSIWDFVLKLFQTENQIPPAIERRL